MWGQSSLMKSYLSLTDLLIWKLHLEVLFQPAFSPYLKKHTSSRVDGPSAFWEGFQGKKKVCVGGYNAGTKQKQERRSRGTNEAQVKATLGFPCLAPGHPLVAGIEPAAPLVPCYWHGLDPSRLMLVLSASSILLKEHDGIHPHPKVLPGYMACRQISFLAAPAIRAAQRGERGVSMEAGPFGVVEMVIHWSHNLLTQHIHFSDIPARKTDILAGSDDAGKRHSWSPALEAAVVGAALYKQENTH